MMHDHPFAEWINLAQPRLGASVVYATDEFFAAKERLIKPEAPLFIPDKYDHHGKWMDGWESRRKRGPGHDYCILQLGTPGIIKGFEVDNSHFTGNYPPSISIDGSLTESPPSNEDDWTELVAKQAVQGDQQHCFAVFDETPWNYLRLHLYPDGGVARLRVFGQVARQWCSSDFQTEHDLVAIENGGRAICCNDMHYGHMSNLLAPGRGINMGDGWETRRRREPGNDWVVLALGHTGVIERIEIDTAHFKGNYPESCSLEGVLAVDDNPDCGDIHGLPWQTLMPKANLGPDQVHTFSREITHHIPVNRVRLNIFPDGGISRVRLFGRLHET